MPLEFAKEEVDFIGGGVLLLDGTRAVLLDGTTTRVSLLLLDLGTRGVLVLDGTSVLLLAGTQDWVAG